MYILFDLDGTLTDSAPGIIHSIQYALRKMNRAIPNSETLRLFIGPPLIDSFQKYCGMNPEDAVLAVNTYREYFSETGLFENAPYDGIREVLASLQKSGHKLCVATSKPEEFAVRILEHFKLSEYFEWVVGNTLSESRPTKQAVIEHLMTLIPEINAENTLMVGDRMHDIEGAHLCGLKCAAVLYGFGTEEEFKTYGADYILQDPADIVTLIEHL